MSFPVEKKNRMGGIIEDALTVQNYLPWIENDEDIINVMRKIPLNKSYLRVPITIKHFLDNRDSNSDLQQEIENDAKDIVSVLPTCPFQDIIKQMKILGNIQNRKEVTLRLLLNGRDDLNINLDEINPDLENRKRLLPLENNVLDTYNIKVRKVSSINNGRSEPYHVGTPVKSSMSQRIVQPVSSSFPNNITSNSQMAYSIPAMAEQVPDIFESIQEMPEPRIDSIQILQPVIKMQPDSTASIPSSSSDVNKNHFTFPKMIVRHKPQENMNNIEVGSCLDLSRPGPSNDNSTSDILIDLIEDDISPEISISKSRNFDEKLVLRLIEIFPDTCSDYIRDICDHKQWSDFDDLVTTIIENEDHPKRQRPTSPIGKLDPEEQFETVKGLLPDADPTYLRMKCDMLGFNPEELNKFIIEARDKKDYPTMKDFLRNQQLSAQCKQYTTDFCVEKFIELFPDPHNSFNDPTRIIDIDDYSRLYIKQYFQNKFDRLPLKIINTILRDNNYRIIQSCNHLSGIQNSPLKMKSKRKPICLDSNIKNIPVLQEFAYLEHQDEIEIFLKTKKDKDEEERQFAKNNGLMKTCQCCFDDEVMPKDTFNCPNDCLFCSSCIKRSCEIAFGEGKLNFSCLNDCGEEFSLQILKTILMPKMFSKIAQKKMIAEIKAAGIEDLEMCPFCDFASIPNEGDKIFKCLNPDCMKESCRTCKEPNHIPLHCDEIEKDENVKARVFLENKMTEALLCKCWKCELSFFKEDGCNKMTCTCGAQMCYVCKKPVQDYTHFNGMGGDKYHLCPLYSDDNKLNKEKVMHAVKEAKAQIDQSKLKVDPTTDLQQYYENRARLVNPPQHGILLNLAMRRHVLHGRGRHRHNQ